MVVCTFCAAFPIAMWLAVEHSSQQAPPHNREEPAKAKNRNGSESKAIAHPGTNEQDKGGPQESEWYDTFFDHPTDWLLVLFNCILAIYTMRLYRATSGLQISTAGMHQVAQDQSVEMGKAAVFAEKQMLLAGRQADISEKQKEIARFQFLATHRPEVRIRTVENMTDGDDEGRLIAHVNYVNVGVTEANIVALEGLIVCPGGELKGGHILEPYPVPSDPMTGGGRKFWAIQSGTSIAWIYKAVRDTPSLGPSPVHYCIGRIEYRDSQGRTRETGFCRRFNPESMTWMSEHHPDYEYAY
jgi:hypothetical protein